MTIPVNYYYWWTDKTL